MIEFRSRDGLSCVERNAFEGTKQPIELIRPLKGRMSYAMNPVFSPSIDTRRYVVKTIEHDRYIYEEVE